MKYLIAFFLFGCFNSLHAEDRALVEVGHELVWLDGATLNIDPSALAHKPHPRAYIISRGYTAPSSVCPGYTSAFGNEDNKIWPYVWCVPRKCFFNPMSHGSTNWVETCYELDLPS